MLIALSSFIRRNKLNSFDFMNKDMCVARILILQHLHAIFKHVARQNVC